MLKRIAMPMERCVAAVGKLLVVAGMAASPMNAAGQDGAVIETPAAAARGQAHDAIEALRSEIRMLKELKDAQEALLRWNRLRGGSGEAPASLDEALCREVGHWCDVLPATFGRTVGGMS
ncbi:MAG: hypothetical protein OYH76_19885 [Defluviicoccus sp.]|nr:hypothetical protein [Defluviicoccus sp.]MDE0278163.1 hypothetical protein [Defluviicoccus sp.]